ncbi:MAG: response regulator [Candidatus Omnitrophota bacterium]
MARILVCDDSEFMRERIREILKDNKHEIVGEAENGDDAAGKYAELKPELVTMDILMKPDGLGAIRKILALNKTARIIIISVLEDNQEEVIEGIRAGALGYVTKPVSPEALIAEVKRVLGGR